MKSILIVEDDAQMGLALERGIQAEGYETVLVDNGVDALISVAHKQFGAAIIDVMLPGMSGFEICRHVREAGKSIGVEFDAEEGADDVEYPIYVAHFAQVVDNLISNALRAVPEAGLERARLLQDGAELRLSVHDSGPGMPDAFIPIAFDRFTRPDGQRGGTQGGSGLGLAIVRAIVSSSRGEVRLENRPDGGFTATVTIPQAAATRSIGPTGHGA